LSICTLLEKVLFTPKI